MALVVNKAKKTPATIKSVIPAHIDSSEVLDLGNGLCRGPKWQLNNWPKDEGKYLSQYLDSVQDLISGWTFQEKTFLNINPKFYFFLS